MCPASAVDFFGAVDSHAIQTPGFQAAEVLGTTQSDRVLHITVFASTS